MIAERNAERTLPGLTVYEATNPKGKKKPARLEITESEDVSKHLDWLRSKSQEHFVVLSLDSQNGLIRTDVVHVGATTYCVVAPADILRPAILCGAASVIVAHNHPSGSEEASPEDLAVTERLAKSCACFDIPLLDHVIIGERWNSLKSRSLTASLFDATINF